MAPHRFVSTMLVALASSVAVAGCFEDEEHRAHDGTLNADGYALFVVENDRQQRNDVTLTVREADPEATYVLLYSPDAPRDVGWFAFDPTVKSRCGGDIGEHCRVGDAGYLVDYVKVPKGASEIVLRDDRCGCDGDRASKSWDGYWAVMRVERTNRSNRLTFEVWAKKVEDYAERPDVNQLQ